METASTTTTVTKSNPGFATAQGCTALVTGSSGLCGARTVELLLERGARHVICFDVAAPSASLRERFQQAAAPTGAELTICSGWPDGDLTNVDAVRAAFRQASSNRIDVCFHIAALAGPFFDRHQYEAVNHQGTLHVIEACCEFGVPKLVYSSTPSTRFTGGHITGQTEDELPIPSKFLVPYAESKAQGERAVAAACCDTLKTVSVAPHQVYGPHDNLFLPNLLETAGNGLLRIFGSGKNKISMCHVDNYAHGLLCGADALDDPQSRARGRFYVITDGLAVPFWPTLNQAVVAMGFPDLESKWHLPVWLLYAVAYAANLVGWLGKRKFKLNPFNVRMLTIHRYFSIANAQRDLRYEPIRPFEQAWPETIAWFREHWLPGFRARQQSQSQPAGKSE